MRRLRDPRWCLILVFLGILAVVPLTQVALELRQGERVLALDVFRASPTAANLRAYEHRLEDANWAAHATRPWMRFAEFTWLGDGGAKAVRGPSDWLFYKPGLIDLLSQPPQSPPPSTPQPTSPLAAILDFQEQLRARGIHLVVMPVPNKESVYPDRLTSRAASLRGVLAPRTGHVLEALRAANVEVIDLFREFEHARPTGDAPPGADLYLAQDTHWSPAGIALAARTAARRLLERGWVQPGALTYAERPATVRRLGDIVRMLQSPPIEARTPPETVPCVQVVRRDDDAPYQDDPAAAVLVLGDSFLRVFQRDDPGSAGFVAHLARELRQPLLSLVSDGGGSTLVRQELRARPAFLRHKTVVLWEFVERDLGLGLHGWQKVPLPPEPSPTPPVPAAAP